LFSLDQEHLYQVVSNLKSYSTPDSYKGKGILRKGEIVKLKKKSKS
jgi:ribosomal protein L6P/L9E